MQEQKMGKKGESKRKKGGFTFLHMSKVTDWVRLSKHALQT